MEKYTLLVTGSDRKAILCEDLDSAKDGALRWKNAASTFQDYQVARPYFFIKKASYVIEGVSYFGLFDPIHKVCGIGRLQEDGQIFLEVVSFSGCVVSVCKRLVFVADGAAIYTRA